MRINTMTKVLLLGAGFSNNWGGPVASQMFNWLLARPEVSGDAQLRQCLWDHQKAGGFENALAQVQTDYLNSPSKERKDRLERFQAAINAIFEVMEKGFSSRPSWEFLEATEDQQRSLFHFLVKFDAIFTLNQDLLFERFYLNPREMMLGQRWDMAAVRGMREVRDGSFPYEPAWSCWVPEPTEFNVPPKVQPYYKLHGSYRWQDGTGNELMVMGGSKALTIRSHGVLGWYLSEFQRCLALGGTRLMVIGYGFNDHHVNDALMAAAPSGLQMFIVDLLGADVANPDRGLPLRRVNPFQDVICGVSESRLTETFGNNAVEHAMVMQFFQ
jgi:hypothetical protein